jgi:transcriptional regulator with XRE-family HTH domain
MIDEYNATLRFRQVRNGYLFMEHKQESDIFAERLRKARDKLGMAQADLAAKAGLPATSISHFENGTRKPSFDNLRRLAQALMVSSDYLLGRVDLPEMVKESDPLYRDVQNLNDDDRQLTEAFMQMLANRKKEARHDKE